MPDVDDVYRAKLEFDLGAGAEGHAQNVHYFKLLSKTNASATDTQIAGAISNDFEGAWTTLKTNISPAISYREITVEGVDTDTFQWHKNIGAAGTLAGAAGLVPLRSAIVVSKRTGLRGRRYRGRTFFVPPDETQQLAGVITTPLATAIATYFAAVQTVAVANQFTLAMVIHSPANIVSPQPRLRADTQVNNFVVNTTMGTQRGRQAV